MTFEGIEVFKIDLDINTLARTKTPPTKLTTNKGVKLKNPKPNVNLNNPDWYENFRYELYAAGQ